MAQSFVTNNYDNNNDDPIDPQRVYCTNAIIIKVGRAVAVSLEDAMLPGNKKHKHMCIMFRSRPKWSDGEIGLISKETDNWIRDKYGDNKAPVTFTISHWGNKSVLINGDLNDLCMYLRNKFVTFSQNEQRPPHSELFTGKEKRDRRNGGGGFDKKRGKNGGGRRENKHKHKYKTPKGDKGGNNREKSKQRLENIISKMEHLKQKKRSELNLLDDQQQRLVMLLSNADNMDGKALRFEIKKIGKEFKNKRKFMNATDKQRKRDKKLQRKKQKHSKKLQKQQSKQLKRDRKELNQKRKMQKKLEKEERKRLKREKLEKLSAARIEALPMINASVLSVYVDGYNIIGCDPICRKSMRGRGGGMKKARQRMADLLQQNFMNNLKNMNLSYDVVMKLWFDGNGKNEKYGDIEITFSSKQQIVDDKLVELFSKCTRKENENKLVITSDRELTLRLNDIGVKVMKSSTFYKTYLKEDKNDNDGDNNDGNGNGMEVDDEKDQIMVEDTIDDEDDFVAVMAKKLNFAVNSDGETSEGNGDGDDDDDTAPDEEGGDNDEEDYEFTTIFGEDSEEYEEINDMNVDEMDMD